MEIKQLPTTFIGRGEVRNFVFNQLYEGDKAFLYEIVDGKKVHYEVFRKKVNNQYACVSYPNSKSFGLWAWTFTNLEKAKLKFDILND